jgi:hypothetical protein
MSTEMLTPVLPIFLTQTLHANGSIVNVVDGIARAIRNLIDGFSGSLSDKLRERNAIVLAGYGMAAVAKPLMALSAAFPAATRADGVAEVKSCEADNSPPEAATLIQTARQKAKDGKDDEAIRCAPAGTGRYGAASAEYRLNRRHRMFPEWDSRSHRSQ